MVKIMKKRATTITIVILSILLLGLYTVTSTYSVIVNVIIKDGITKMVDEVTIKDILLNEDGSYSDTYMDIKEELQIDEETAEILMSSPSLNQSLQIVLKSVIEYKIQNNQEAKLSEEAIYNLISKSILETQNIDDELKSKIINKSSTYRLDIAKYLYDIDIVVLGEPT